MMLTILSDLILGTRRKITEESEKPEYDKYGAFRKWAADYHLNGTKNFKISHYRLYRKRTRENVWVANGRSFYQMYSFDSTDAPTTDLSNETKDVVGQIVNDLKSRIFDK